MTATNILLHLNRTIDMKDSIWTYRLNDSEFLNKEILKVIASAPSHRSDIGCDKIGNSDYDLEDRSLSSSYGNLFFDFAEPWVKAVNEHYHTSEFRVEGFWFHQYVTGDIFNFHVHPKCNLSFIYYVELPDKSATTEFYHVERDEVFQPDVSEGDIVIFPSYYPHRSPLITSASRKTILSGNISLYYAGNL